MAITGQIRADDPQEWQGFISQLLRGDFSGITADAIPATDAQAPQPQPTKLDLLKSLVSGQASAPPMPAPDATGVPMQSAENPAPSPAPLSTISAMFTPPDASSGGSAASMGTSGTGIPGHDRTPLTDAVANSRTPEPQPPVIPGQVSPLPSALVQPPDSMAHDFKGSFAAVHPKLNSFLHNLVTFAENAGPGIGAPTFGQGFATAAEQPSIRAYRAADIAGKQASTQKTQAETRAILNPPGKPGVSEPIMDGAKNIVGFRDARGNILGPNNPNLSQDQKDILAVSQGKPKPAGTPKAQVFQAFLSDGLSPEDAYKKTEILSSFAQTKFLPVKLPTGEMGVGVFDKQGKFLQMAENSMLPSGYYEKVTHGQHFETDANGNVVEIGTTTTSSPQIPGAPSPGRTGVAPAPGAAQPPAGAPRSFVGRLTGQNPAPANAPAPARPAAGGVNARPVMIGGQPLQKAAAADMGTAVDPQTNQYYVVSRSDAAKNGYSNFTKQTGPSIETMKGDNRRLVDINTKVGQYAKDFDETAPLSMGDKYIIQNLLADDAMTHGIAGEGLQAAQAQISKWIDAAPAAVRARMQGNLSTQGAQRYIDYVNAREALSGFQKVLTNQGRSSDKILELQLQSLPQPNADEQFGTQTGAAFISQLQNVTQGRPLIPGMTNPLEPLNLTVSELQRRKTAAVANDKAASRNPALKDERGFTDFARWLTGRK